MTKYKIGPAYDSWQDFIADIKDGKFFYFHDDLTQSQVAMGWQISTILRIMKMKGSLKRAVEK